MTGLMPERTGLTPPGLASSGLASSGLASSGTVGPEEIALTSTSDLRVVATGAARSAATAAPVVTVRRDHVAARAALVRASDHLLSLQDDEGWWKGDLLSNVTMEAEDIFVRHALGLRDPADREATARWIRSQQLADGGWALWPGAPGDVSTTVEAYVALRMAGDSADAPHLLRAAELVQTRGGVEATRAFTRIWLAMLGLWSWDACPAMPPELVLLPKSFPLALPQWACWARQTAVPMTVVWSHRPVFPVGFGIEELMTGVIPARPTDSIGRAFSLFDRALHVYEAHPIGPVRRHALGEATRWIVERQEADGSWGGIQPPWVWSLLALHLQGYALEHPVMAAGLAGLERFTLREQGADGPVRHLEACQSPVWDTALALIALTDAGMAVGDKALQRAARWLTAEEVTVRGDWAHARPDLAAGGWSFEFDNDLYPDVDDTAEVAIALRRFPEPGRRAAIERGVAWMLGMQCRDGGWAAFDADQFGKWPDRLPFCDFGEVTDPPSADVTAHVVETLCLEGLGDSEAVRRGVEWLLAHQEADGSWFGRWGVNCVYGTGAVLPGLAAAGLSADSPAVAAGVRWLLDFQQADGGWGETVTSYRAPRLRGRGDPTPSQTAWALIGLLAVDTDDVDVQAAIDRGVGWLVTHQRADGSWDEEAHTGTGFPGDFSISYGLYRIVFPVSALGRYLGRRR